MLHLTHLVCCRSYNLLLLMKPMENTIMNKLINPSLQFADFTILHFFISLVEIIWDAAVESPCFVIIVYHVGRDDCALCKGPAT